MLSRRQWIYKDVSMNEVKRVSEAAGISPFIAKVLLSRGISDIDYIKQFLNSSAEDLHDPFLMKDMDKAVERIVSAINANEKIIIYGDYDVDGVTSTSILYNFLVSQHAEVDYYIPDRIEEGYGLSISVLEKVLQKRCSLIITVDCGITAIEEVDYVNKNGVDIIITDHHACKDILPSAYAVVSPSRTDCTYPFQHLAGVGVVYKLLNALCLKLGLGDLYQSYLEFVALGTVADVVPLTGENRIIVKYGLERIIDTGNIGLRTLVENCELKDRILSSWVISFVIAPRINAAGRIGSAKRAVELFTTANERQSQIIVEQLNQDNKFRQETEAQIMQQVVNNIENSIDLDKEKVIVVAGEGWHHGVIGIVASKITDRYYRPCILLSLENGLAKGSGRSIEGFDLFKALSHCEQHLERFGGHQMAAGLSVKGNNISNLREAINLYADSMMSKQDMIPKLIIDVVLNKDDICIENVKDIELLSPFGAGNQGPLFLYTGCKISEARAVGDNKHLKLKLQNEGIYLDAIGFNMGDFNNQINRTQLFDVAGAMEINNWNSMQKIQLNLKDIKSSYG